jgi:hypothetical protein
VPKEIQSKSKYNEEKCISKIHSKKKKADKKIKKGEEKEEKKKVCVCVFFILGEFD